MEASAQVQKDCKGVNSWNGLVQLLYCHPLTAKPMEEARLWAEPYEIVGAGGKEVDDK